MSLQILIQTSVGAAGAVGSTPNSFKSSSKLTHLSSPAIAKNSSSNSFFFSAEISSVTPAASYILCCQTHPSSRVIHPLLSVSIYLKSSSGVGYAPAP